MAWDRMRGLQIDLMYLTGCEAVEGHNCLAACLKQEEGVILFFPVNTCDSPAETNFPHQKKRPYMKATVSSTVGKIYYQMFPSCRKIQNTLSTEYDATAMTAVAQRMYSMVQNDPFKQVVSSPVFMFKICFSTKCLLVEHMININMLILFTIISDSPTLCGTQSQDLKLLIKMEVLVNRYIFSFKNVKLSDFSQQ